MEPIIINNMGKSIRISDPLLLFPSSKIVSSANGKLVDECELSTVIKYFKSNSHVSDRIPVATLSIVGSSSQEKHTLAKALVNCFESEHRSTESLFSDRYVPKEKDLQTSGIFLINKAFFVEMSEGGYQLAWILYIYEGIKGTARDLQLLEWYLLFISSKIVEVKAENELIRILVRQQELELLIEKNVRWSPLCHNFLYVFSKEDISPNQHFPLSLGNKALQKLVLQMPASSHAALKASTSDGMLELSIIEMAIANKFEDVIEKSLVERLQEEHKFMKLPTKHNNKGERLRLECFHGFMKNTVQFINALKRFESQSMSRTAQPNSTNSSILAKYTAVSDNSKEMQNVEGKQAYLQSDKHGKENAKREYMPNWLTKILPKGSFGNSKQIEEMELSSLQRESEISTEDNNLPGMSKIMEGVDAVCHISHMPETKGSRFDFTNKAEEQNEDMRLAKKLIGIAIAFYDEEMQRLLEEDVWDPNTLHTSHVTLVEDIITEFTMPFTLEEGQSSKFKRELMDKLEGNFTGHLKKNTLNLKLKQMAISKCLQNCMSFYMKEIESVIQENPHGLRLRKLEEKKNEIVKEAMDKLEAEIKENIREKEPLECHRMSLLAEIDEYWECVLERNNENLKGQKESLAEVKSASANNSIINEPDMQHAMSVEEIQKNFTQGDTSDGLEAEQTSSNSANKKLVGDTPSEDARHELNNLVDKIRNRLYHCRGNHLTSTYKEQLVILEQEASTVLGNSSSTLAQLREQIRNLRGITYNSNREDFEESASNDGRADGSCFGIAWNFYGN